MLKFILLLTISLYSYALNIRLNIGRENFNNYSVLHIKNNTKFLCTNTKIQLICAFTKKPASNITPIENNFFKISTKIQDNIFFIIIKPKYKFFISSIAFDLIKNKTIYKTDTKKSKNWFIVGYKTKLPFLESTQKSKKGLSLPITFTSLKLPYIGALDIYGRPIKISQLEDIKLYIKIKDTYKKKKYNDVLPLINEALSKYPNSMFNNQYLFYKIKIYSKLDDDAYLVSASSVYLRKYSDNEHVAEVLLLTADAYLKLKSKNKADYFYDRLLSEHSGSKYAKLALITLGDISLKSRHDQRALSYYAKALDTTKNLDIASLAAFKIAMYGLQHEMVEDAVNYIKKIINANPKFFIHYGNDTLQLAKQIVNKKRYLLATKIITILLKSLPDTATNYQLLLKDKGVWLVKANRKKEAIKTLDNYISKFKNGDYIDIVKKTKYSLFFNENNKNSIKKLKNYNYLIKKYKGENIAKKALQKKVKLLYGLKKYSTVLALKLKNENKFVQKSAKILLIQMMDKQKCYKAIKLFQVYKIKLTDGLDNGIFKCAKDTLNYKIAKNIAKKHINSKILTQRMRWMYRFAQVDYKLKNYNQVLKVGDDLIAILGDVKYSQYNNIYRILFDTFLNLKNNAKMISTIKIIILKFGVNYQDITRYMQMVNLGVHLKDNNIIIVYGNYIYKLQNKTNVYQQSPYIEFTLAQAYIDDNHVQKALEILSSLDKVKLTLLQKSRQKYLIGSLLQKLWKNKDAKIAFEESIKADKGSPWASLSKDALNLL